MKHKPIASYVLLLIGYTALHQAAAWGKIESLKALVDGGADLQLRTKNKERARETALRYNQTECVDYLDWAGTVKKTYIYIIMVSKYNLQSNDRSKHNLLQRGC